MRKYHRSCHYIKSFNLNPTGINLMIHPHGVHVSCNVYLIITIFHNAERSFIARYFFVIVLVGI